MKKILGIAALASLMMVGCTQETVDHTPAPSDPDYIHVSATTGASPLTKAAVVDLTALQASDGFEVYGTSANATSWYKDDAGADIAGDNLHKWSDSDSDWDFENPVKWPADANQYPMNFYAWYPAVPVNDTYLPAGGTNLNATTDGTTTEITFDYNVQPAASTLVASALPASQQEDLISAKEEGVAGKPAGSHLSMTFNHQLSKVDFGVIPTDAVGNGDYTAYVQAIGIANLAESGTFDAVAQAWNTPGAYTYTASYTYAGQFSDGTNATALTPIEFIGTNGTDPMSFSTATDAHLMLMPQDPGANAANPKAAYATDGNMWDPQNAALVADAPAADDGLAAFSAFDAVKGASIIEMIYRCEGETGSMAGDNPDYVGYAQAQSHPYFAAYLAAKAANEGAAATAYDDFLSNPLNAYIIANPTTPLFVKVGYGYDGEWKAGYGYTYNIQIPGTSGGMLLDQRYYDENGNPTGLVVGDLDGDNVPTYPIVPDPVLGDDYIHLVPTITNWNDQPTEVLGDEPNPNN